MIVSAISSFMSDLENTLYYQLLIQGDEKNTNLITSKPIFLVLVIGLIILMITQYRIEVLKKSVKAKCSFNPLRMETLEDEENQGAICIHSNFDTHRAEIITVGFFVLTILIWLIIRPKDLSMKILMGLFFRFAMLLTFFSLFILRNQRLYSFLKHQIYFKPLWHMCLLKNGPIMKKNPYVISDSILPKTYDNYNFDQDKEAFEIEVLMQPFIHTLGPIVYFIEGKSPSRHKRRFFF